MTHQEEHPGERASKGASTAQPSDVTRETWNRFEALTDAQTELWNRLQDSNRKWLNRAQDEASLAVELASKLTASRSFSESATVVQNWTTKHVELAAEDARHLLADAQKVMEAGTRFWSIMGPRGKSGGKEGGLWS